MIEALPEEVPPPTGGCINPLKYSIRRQRIEEFSHYIQMVSTYFFKKTEVTCCLKLYNDLHYIE